MFFLSFFDVFIYSFLIRLDICYRNKNKISIHYEFLFIVEQEDSWCVYSKRKVVHLQWGKQPFIIYIRIKLRSGSGRRKKENSNIKKVKSLNPRIPLANTITSFCLCNTCIILCWYHYLYSVWINYSSYSFISFSRTMR